jgi:hypothetical protein
MAEGGAALPPEGTPKGVLCMSMDSAIVVVLPVSNLASASAPTE